MWERLQTEFTLPPLNRVQARLASLFLWDCGAMHRKYPEDYPHGAEQH